jgi:uncharacterized YccA/Bax inhibitor family protein
VSNPYLSNDPYFGDTEAAAKNRQRLGISPAAPQQPGYGSYAPGAASATLPPVPVVADRLEQQWAMPTATAQQTGRMTYDDVIVKTASLLGVIVLVGALAWWAPANLKMPLMIVGLIGGLVLGLVNSFKKEPSAPLILAYAAFEGLFLGAISQVFDARWPGIVVQAVLATLATFAAVLMLFKSGKVRNTPKFQRIVLVALVGYALFSLVNLVLVWTGVMSGWGMRSGGFGILIGVAAVILAAATLVIDFDRIQQGVRRGAPARYAWAAAFGLAVTLVWMYLEFLRLLAILRGD